MPKRKVQRALRRLSRALTLTLAEAAARANAASRIFGSAGDEHALRRIQRHLEDLERTNYTESSGRAGAWRGGALGAIEHLADEGEGLGGTALVNDETGRFSSPACRRLRLQAPMQERSAGRRQTCGPC